MKKINTKKIVLTLFYVGIIIFSSHAQNFFNQVVVGPNPPSSVPGFSTLWLQGNDNPSILFNQTTQAANRRLWSLSVIGTQFRVFTETDNFGSIKNAMVFQRGSGTNLDYVSFPEGNFGAGVLTPAGKFHFSSGTSGDAELRLEADTDNNDEMDNPYIAFIQDGNQVGGYIGMIGNTNTAPQLPKYHYAGNTVYNGTITNSLFIGTNFSENVQIGTNGNVRMTVKENGNIGVGTLNPTALFTVNGKIEAEEIEVKAVGADYVFEDGYQLRSLEEVEAFIIANKHLPDIAPASVTEQGVELGEFTEKLLQKIEELTLYTIELKKEVELLKANQK